MKFCPEIGLLFMICFGPLFAAAIVADATNDAEPLPKPVPGLTAPVTITKIVDGDTCSVRLGSFEWRIRLIDTWAPELKEKGGPESKAWVESYVKKHAGEETLVHIPWPKKHKANPLGYLSMERVPGYIWIGNGCLNELIVSNGHATKTKRAK